MAPDGVISLSGDVSAQTVAAERIEPQAPALVGDAAVVPATRIAPSLLSRQSRCKLLRRLYESGVELLHVVR